MMPGDQLAVKVTEIREPNGSPDVIGHVVLRSYHGDTVELHVIDHELDRWAPGSEWLLSLKPIERTLAPGRGVAAGGESDPEAVEHPGVAPAQTSFDAEEEF